MFATLFALLCAVYLLAIPWAPPLVGALLKILPIQMLVVRAASRAPDGARTCLVLGLIFSLAGDAILALSPEALFIQGVGAFLVAHVLYVLAFRPGVRYSRRSLLLAVLAVGWCAAIGSTVFPHLGPLRVPVVAYILVIAAMGVTAAFATGPRITLFFGAFAFIVSDSVLAVDRFVAPFRLAPYLVMITYYTGQFFIVEGVIRRFAGRPDGSVTARQ